MPDAKPAAGSDSQPAAAPIALYYTGDGEQHIHGVPSRDLTDADVDRLVYVESVTPDKPGLTAADVGFSKARDALVDRLAASPLYRKTAPKE